MASDLFPDENSAHLTINVYSENSLQEDVVKKENCQIKGKRDKLRPYLNRMQTYTARVGAISDHLFQGKPRTFVMLRHLKRNDEYIDNHIWVFKTPSLAGVRIGDWIKFNAVAGQYLRGVGRALSAGSGSVSSDLGLRKVCRVETIKRLGQ